MDPNEEKRIDALLESLEKEDRRRNNSLQTELIAARRILFEDSGEEDFLVRDEDENEVDKLTQTDHDSNSEIEFEIPDTDFQGQVR